MVEIGPYLVGGPADIGWPDGLMCLLGIGGLCLVNTWFFRDISRAIARTNIITQCGDGLGAKLNPISSHIGDQTGGLTANVDTFIELLGNLHGPASGETKFPGCFLLQCRGGKRRGRITADAFGLNILDEQRAAVDFCNRCQRLVFGADAQLVQLLAVQMGQPGVKIATIGLPQFGLHTPIFMADKRLDLCFTLTDQSKGNRLYAAGGT